MPDWTKVNRVGLYLHIYELGQSLLGMLGGLGAAFCSTAASELGDRSFITAVLLSLKQPPWVVFWATWCALSVQSICSVLIGTVLRTISGSHRWNFSLACIAGSLYAIFATHHFYSACFSTPLDLQEQLLDCGRLDEDLLEASELTAPSSLVSGEARVRARDVARINKVGLSSGNKTVFVGVFLAVYIAEFGDSSMFVTAALATKQNPLVVAIGRSLICTHTTQRCDDTTQTCT